MTEILMRIMGIMQRIRSMEELNMFSVAFFAVIFAFGFLNCILGYRLLRFWIMLFGFAMGAAGGLWIINSMDTGMTSKYTYLIAAIAGGILLSVIAFLIYKAGLFILGAGIGMFLSISILAPTTSSMFFLCILIGVGVGTLGLRYAKEVIIIGTSILGGLASGFCLAKIGKLDEMPYGILFGIAFVFLGILIQFMINRDRDEEENEEPMEEDQELQMQAEYEAETEYQELLEWEDEEARSRRRRAKIANEIRSEKELYEQMRRKEQKNGKRKRD